MRTHGISMSGNTCDLNETEKFRLIQRFPGQLLDDSKFDEGDIGPDKR